MWDFSHIDDITKIPLGGIFLQSKKSLSNQKLQTGCTSGAYSNVHTTHTKTHISNKAYQLYTTPHIVKTIRTNNKTLTKYSSLRAQKRKRFHLPLASPYKPATVTHIIILGRPQNVLKGIQFVVLLATTNHQKPQYIVIVSLLTNFAKSYQKAYNQII